MGNINSDEWEVGYMATDIILEMAARMNPLHGQDPYEETPVESLYEDLSGQGTGLYVDTTILSGLHQVQLAISQTIEQWPEEKPPIHFITVYARPTKVEAWKSYLHGTHTKLGRQVVEIDKPSQNPAVQITADAIHHLLIQRIGHVAVICDKLAIGTLFRKIQEISPPDNGRWPAFTSVEVQKPEPPEPPEPTPQSIFDMLHPGPPPPIRNIRRLRRGKP